MRILVTGASGWTGKAVLEVLGREHELRAFDRPNVEWDRESTDWTGEVFEGDITDLETVRKAVSGMDAIVHMAVASFRSGTPYGSDDEPTPSLPFSVNVQGTYNVLESAQRAGIRRVVMLASASLEHLQREPPERADGSIEWMDQPGLYGITKYLQERIGWFYALTRGMEVFVLRCGYIVDGASGKTKYGQQLRDADVTGPWSGAWVDRYDIARAIGRAIKIDHAGFEILYLIGWHRGNEYFDIDRTRSRLGFEFDRDFAEYG